MACFGTASLTKKAFSYKQQRHFLLGALLCPPKLDKPFISQHLCEAVFPIRNRAISSRRRKFPQCRIDNTQGYVNEIAVISPYPHYLRCNNK
jgi:hypothetical protein